MSLPHNATTCIKKWCRVNRGMALASSLLQVSYAALADGQDTGQGYTWFRACRTSGCCAY